MIFTVVILKSFLKRWYVICVFCGGILLGQGGYIQAKALVAQWLIAKAWSENQINEIKDAIPWPWADTRPVAQLRWFSNETQDEPDASHYVLEGTDGPTLAFGPGLSYDSYHPQQGHVVISGHKDTHFAFLEQVKLGDRFSLLLDTGEEFSYQVHDISIININTHQLLIQEDQKVLTLTTCYPFDPLIVGGPLRLRIDSTLLSTKNRTSMVHTQYANASGDKIYL